MVLDMPNTYPPIIDAQALARKVRLAGAKALCDIAFFVGATGTNADAAAALASEVAGLKIYLDDTYGPLGIRAPSGSSGRGLSALLAHFCTWPAGRPIAVHAEGLSTAIAIGLARSFGRRLHLCHVSRADEIRLIRAAKASGADLTCEVAPHHLFLTQTDAERLGGYGSMKPPLATEEDRAALWANLEVVDCIATDHAPHTSEEKEGEKPPPGVPGLEAMLPLLLTAVAGGRLSMERLVELTYQGPRRVYGLPAQPNTWVDTDPEARYPLHGGGLHTKCGWTPFEGLVVQGRVLRVVLRGQTAFEDGRIRVAPGFGRVVVPGASFQV